MTPMDMTKREFLSLSVLGAAAPAVSAAGAPGRDRGGPPTDAGYPLHDEDGRETHPMVQSADITFNYA